MNRFVPESWLEALLRPLAMALPEGWIYIEVIAPDLRLALLLVLLAISAGAALRGGPVPSRAALVLAGFAGLAFIAWLATTGNGRYFIPVLMLSGVLCIAVIHRLPASRSFRVTLALCALVLQGYAVMQNHPWRPGSSWAMVEWGDAPALQVELDAQALQEPATYVGLSVISYSLVAPQFPAQSRWINISALHGVGPDAPDARRAREFLAQSGPLRLMVPALAGGMARDGKPTADAVRAINHLLAQRELALWEPSACRLLPVRQSGLDEPDSDTGAPVGFWACPLAFPVPFEPPSAASDRVARAFEALEKLCPRRFPPGLTAVTPTPGGAMRHYQGADMKVYVTPDEAVYYKHHRALSAQFAGTVSDILQPGFRLDCGSIRGQFGLPWSREM